MRFRRDGPAGTLRLSAAASDGAELVVTAQSRHGVYVDADTGTPIGRDLGERLYLDADAVDDALSRANREHGSDQSWPAENHDRDEPKLCPAPEPDVAHGAKEHILDYEDDVHRRVNPEAPIPRGFSVRVIDPLTGRVQYPDDCFRDHGDLVDGDMEQGDLAEGKNEVFARLILNEDLQDFIVTKLKKQLAKYVRAADARGSHVKLYLTDEQAVTIVRKESTGTKM